MQAVRKPYLVHRQSALVLKCSDMEPAPQILCEHFGPSAADGVSAHLNLLYPFTTNLSMDDDDALIDVLRDFGWLHIDFTSTGWFGADSVYPVPGETATLTSPATRIYKVFPEYPTFGAVPEQVVPHVTIGKRVPLSELKAAEAEVLGKLPVRQVYTIVELWSSSPPGTSRWQRHRTYQLGTRPHRPGSWLSRVARDERPASKPSGS